MRGKKPDHRLCTIFLFFILLHSLTFFRLSFVFGTLVTDLGFILYVIHIRTYTGNCKLSRIVYVCAFMHAFRSLHLLHHRNGFGTSRRLVNFKILKQSILKTKNDVKAYYLPWVFRSLFIISDFYFVLFLEN